MRQIEKSRSCRPKALLVVFSVQIDSYRKHLSQNSKKLASVRTYNSRWVFIFWMKNLKNFSFFPPSRPKGFVRFSYSCRGTHAEPAEERRGFGFRNPRLIADSYPRFMKFHTRTRTNIHGNQANRMDISRAPIIKGSLNYRGYQSCNPLR